MKWPVPSGSSSARCVAVSTSQAAGCSEIDWPSSTLRRNTPPAVAGTTSYRCAALPVQVATLGRYLFSGVLPTQRS
ncbi:hypothetical protein SK571_01845 [Lentzea sp. BCCO 10_0798]|uniref:Uncharacterized protein n=1 Tax=Lentzea kristufekii TaxID=3095430 RepID=A0ABU4TIP0_9PSEU|nr:hypothetical protein [Lentzea sp. BCCO 10_0798]MDX8048113.1 hypothetical protein [Lentzea sp. BCCO 10_0798]